MAEVANSEKNWLSETVKVSQLIYTIIGVFVLGIGFVFSAATEFAVMKKDIEQQKEETRRRDQEYKDLQGTMSKIDDKTNQIMILLQNKEDRK